MGNEAVVEEVNVECVARLQLSVDAGHLDAGGGDAVGSCVSSGGSAGEGR